MLSMASSSGSFGITTSTSQMAPTSFSLTDLFFDGFSSEEKVYPSRAPTPLGLLDAVAPASSTSPLQILPSSFAFDSLSPILPSSQASDGFSMQPFDWKPKSSSYQQSLDDGYTQYDFTFQTRHVQSSAVNSTEKAFTEEDNKPWSSMAAMEFKSQELSGNPEVGNNRIQAPPNPQRSLNDGYNWRKYGQKQVKGSENPRSYYKCVQLNCPTKKKVETNQEGHITEVVYIGTHNHPKPPSTRRNSSAPSMRLQYSSIHSEPPEKYYAGASHSEHSTASVEDDFEDEEPDAKRWMEEGKAGGSSANGLVRQPRVIVQTTSEMDILDDGYRWRKYGQKVVKSNPNPRSYYRCTEPGCQVRKLVERASHDPGAVITTYEGKHNHDPPPARGSGLTRSANQPFDSITQGTDVGSTAAFTFAPSAITGSHAMHQTEGAVASNNDMLFSRAGFFHHHQQPPPPTMLETGTVPSNGAYSGIVDFAGNLTAKEEPIDDVSLDSLLF